MNDFLKETGKYLYDISKIVLGLGIITPFIKGTEISLYPIIASFIIFTMGAFMIYKGGSK